MTIERVFNQNSKIKFENFMNEIISEQLDKAIQEYYNTDKVDFATSPENKCKGDVA